MVDIEHSLGEDGVKLESVDGDIVMDIKPARGEDMVVVEPGNGDRVDIILVEAEPTENVITDKESQDFYTHIPEDTMLQEHLEASGQILDDHRRVHQGGPQVGDIGGGGHGADSDGWRAGGGRHEHGVGDDHTSI